MVSMEDIIAKLAQDVHTLVRGQAWLSRTVHNTHETVQRIDAKESILAATIQDLKDEITSHTTIVASYQSTVQDLIGKLQSSEVAEDFSDEINQLKSLDSSLTTAQATLTQTTATTPTTLPSPSNAAAIAPNEPAVQADPGAAVVDPNATNQAAA